MRRGGFVLAGVALGTVVLVISKKRDDYMFFVVLDEARIVTQDKFAPGGTNAEVVVSHSALLSRTSERAQAALDQRTVGSAARPLATPGTLHPGGTAHQITRQARAGYGGSPGALPATMVALRP
jgi:hypothetical protein